MSSLRGTIRKIGNLTPAAVAVNIAEIRVRSAQHVATLTIRWPFSS